MASALCEYPIETVLLYYGRKEASTSASETLWTNIHTRCGYTELHMSNHLSTDVYLQMVWVGRVCARLLILFAFASLSVYRSLTALGILHIRSASHQSVTYGSFSWRNQFVLSKSQGQLQQVFRCTCTSVERASGQRDQDATQATSFRVWSFRFLRVQFKRRCLTGMLAWDEQTPGILGDRGWIDARRQVSPRLSVQSFLTFTPTRTIQAPRKETVANKSSCSSPKLGASCPDGWRSPQLHECTNRWAFKTPFFINSITPQLPSPFPPCLISPPPWAKVIICSFIKLDNIPCFVGACTQESRPYCSSLQHFVLLAHYFTHALLFYQALLK